jgi:probable rRNA maturation factor
MNVDISDEHPDSGLAPELLTGWAEAALAAEGCPPGTAVSVHLVEDSVMADWNRRALRREGPTDVLSFPLEDLAPGRLPPPSPQGPPLVIGDVLIAPDYVRRQATALGVQWEDEMALMVTHGILHLLGYDHEDDAEAQVMETREKVILAAQGRVRRP